MFRRERKEDPAGTRAGIYRIVGWGGTAQRSSLRWKLRAHADDESV